MPFDFHRFSASVSCSKRVLIFGVEVGVTAFEVEECALVFGVETGVTTFDSGNGLTSSIPAPVIKIIIIIRIAIFFLIAVLS